MKRNLERSGNIHVEMKQSGAPRFWERKLP
jgi:hypothetical protein